MPSEETGREIYRATFAGVDELSDQIKEAMERQASKVYAYSLRRAADSIRSMKFVEHAHDKLIRLAEDEDRAIGLDDKRDLLEEAHERGREQEQEFRKRIIDLAEGAHKASAYQAAAEAIAELEAYLAPPESPETAVAGFRAAAVTLLTNRAKTCETAPPRKDPQNKEPERGPWADVLPPDCWICGREVIDSPLVQRTVHRQCEEGRLVALEDAQEKVARQADPEKPKDSRLREDARQLALLARALGIAMQPDEEGWPKGVLPQKDRDALVKHADAVLDALKVEEPRGFYLSREAFIIAHNICHVVDHYDLGDNKRDDVASVTIADLRRFRAALHGGAMPHLCIDVCEYWALPAMLPKREPKFPLNFISHEETQAKMRQFTNLTKRAQRVSVPDLLRGVPAGPANVKIRTDHGPCLVCGKTIEVSEGLFIRDDGNAHSPRCPTSLGFCTSCDQEKFEGVEHVHDYKAQRRSGEEPEPVAPRLCEERGWCELPFEHEERCAPAERPESIQCPACHLWHPPPACTKEGAKT